LRDAFENRYDTAILISADNDITPVLEAIHNRVSTKTIGVLLPIGRKNLAHDLREHANFIMQIKLKHLSSSQFKDEINLNDGSILHKPREWINSTNL